MIIKEFRIPLPLSVEEYQVAQLYAVAEASKNETGGGDGIEVVANEPYNDPSKPGGKGQYTHKIYHLSSKVPKFIRILAPDGALEVEEEAWNAYPYCRTVITNPYMNDNFFLTIETWHKPGLPTIENVHNLNPEQLKKREVVHINVSKNADIAAKYYNEEEDPTLFVSKKAGRGPFLENFAESTEPLMTCYKLVTMDFKWFGLQTRVESYALKVERRLFCNFHRQLVCWMDQWYGMTMEDIRALEDKTKDDLQNMRNTGEVRGIKED